MSRRSRAASRRARTKDRHVTCSHRGKRRFRSHREAVHALHMVATHSTRDRIPLRAYECDTCHGWFITSQAAA